MSDPDGKEEDYTILCLLDDEKIPFSIDIPSGKLVDHLKAKIKEKRPDRFSNIPARFMNLFLVNIPDGHDLVARVGEQKLDNALPVWWTMAEVFGGKPERLPVHILVHPPATTTPPASLPQIPFISIKDEEIKKFVAEFDIDLRFRLNTFLKGDVQLPLWQSLSGPDEIRSHIAGLKIPKISPSSQFPLLLLHNLGQPSHDQQLVERVNRLFLPGSRKFVCNTSGSGKTRLLLEGLWGNWGFYFTARTQPEGVGSSDLEEVLLDMERFGRLTPITDQNRATALTQNQEVASRRFLLILYARIFIFRAFLECASAMPGGITANHKGRWLLIQVAPETLLLRDVFRSFVRLVGRASKEYLFEAIELDLPRVERLLGLQSTALFCVLDEAQIPTNKLSDCFRSETNPTQPRPILREIIQTWTLMFPNLIVSGTDLSMQDLEAVLVSVVAKEGGIATETVTDIGAFDNEEDQRAHLQYYCPPGFLDTDLGMEVASRSGYWLHGRHRFTATYISRLIQTSFESPHRVLNDFVYSMTNFRPSDLDDDSSPLIELMKPHGFDFSKLKDDPGLFRQVAGFIFDYIFNGKPRNLGGLSDKRLVEYGVARFGNMKKIIADEPLALLAAVHYFTTETSWSLQYFLQNGLSTPNESARGIAFEQLGAYLIGIAFKSPTRLSTVFQFIVPHELENEVAELVSVHKTDRGLVCNPIDISSEMRPTYILGRTTRTEEETLDWLRNPERAIFCFPANTVGPDLMLLLRLSDHSLIRVLVQFKHLSSLTIGPHDTEVAFNTTDPNKFVSQSARSLSVIGDVSSPVKKNTKRERTAKHPRDPQTTQNLLDALKDLGTGSDKAGRFSVLRVLATFPAKPDFDTLTELVKADTNEHPAALLNVELLATHPSEKELFESLRRGVVEAARQKKRKANDGPVSESKRRKTQDHMAARSVP
ncbi:hypothetical protein M408DRAFT_210132 [Serendipita vermifera MAFF 305830]|uniref:Crinkler effector protein N-terminal domain-containing protein n=1 Tax=Serendipita vermifera MAFF 305830 TaxID=933852 RepID=A0A0C2WG36_SERVB|nr:hypothetical protein M408DRAFT_210132 [Serendipita vermifera MAFF 305830]